MHRVRLPGTSIETSSLGFGCVSLTAHDSLPRALRILETALDAGITHFDTARLYGAGQSESILGRFLEGKRDRVTVATKFGLQPSAAMTRGRRLVSLARWLAHRSGVVRRLARRATAGSVQQGLFDPASAAASLEVSLRELRTDYVDLLLLHECTLADAAREDLIAFLSDQVARGRVRAFGLASPVVKIGLDASVIPAAHRILQFDSTPLDRHVERLQGAEGRVLITHSAVASAKRLAETAGADPARAAEWRARLEIDPTVPGALVPFILRDAVRSNPGGIVLFASTSQDRIRANAACGASASADDPRQQAFAELSRQLAASHTPAAPVA